MFILFFKYFKCEIRLATLQHMITFLRSIFSPILSLVIIMIGSGYFNTFLSLRITDTGGPPWLAGLIYASFYAGMMVGGFRMENLIKRVGHIRAFSIFAATMGSFVLIQGFTESILWWLIFRFVVGVSCAGLFIVIESWLLLLSSPKTRGTILAIYMIALYAAQGSGQFLLNAFKIGGLGAFTITAILSSFSIIPVCLMKASYPNLTETERVSVPYLFKKSPLGFIGCFIAGLILSAFYALGPIYAREMNMSILQVSQIMGFTIIGGLVLQTPLGYLSDIIERRKVIILTSLLLTLTCVAILFSSHYSFFILVLLFVMYGGFSFTLYPLCITYCCDFFSNAGITAITASCLIVYGIGCIIGPLISPIFINYLGANGLIVYLGIFAGTLTCFGFIRAVCKPPPPKEMHEDFMALPRTSPQAYQLDPRSDETPKED